MRGAGQIRDLGARCAAGPRRDHVDRSGPPRADLGSLENIARAKAELLEELPGRGRRSSAGARARPRGLACRTSRLPTCGASRSRRQRSATGGTHVHWRGGRGRGSGSPPGIRRTNAGRGADGGRSARRRAAEASRCRSSSRSRRWPRPSCPATACSSTTPGTRIRWRCAPHSHISRTTPTAAARLRSSARWRSSGRRLGRYHEEIGERVAGHRRRTGRRRARAGLRAGRVGRKCGGRGGRGRRRSRPAGRRDPRQGLALRRPRDCRRRAARSGRRDPRPHRRGGGALPSGVAIGPRFIDFLRRNEFGQHIREEGPRHHIAKQGTPTMGGLLILFAATVAFLPVSHFRLQSLAVIFTALACGAIGFLDDFIKLTHKRSLGLSGRWKLLLLAGVTVVVAIVARHLHLSTDVVHPVDRRHRAVVVRLVLLPLLRDRRRVERDEPRRRRRRAPRGHGDHRPFHVHGDERCLVPPVWRRPRTPQPDEARPRDRRGGADRRGDRLSVVQRLPGGDARWATPARWPSAAHLRPSRS